MKPFADTVCVKIQITDVTKKNSEINILKMTIDFIGSKSVNSTTNEKLKNESDK
jgi:hypothetical protein